MRHPHIIVLGNEKGGSGKTTTSMHIAASLMAQGKTVGAMDLDVRQRSFTRYIENRRAFAGRAGLNLPSPEYAKVEISDDRDRVRAAEADEAAIARAIEALAGNDFIIIDCPGSDSVLSRTAHARADTIVTPMNDSFVDFDLLAQVDPDSFEVLSPSLYSEMVWEARKRRALAGGKPIDWLVMRNRLSVLNARNKARVGAVLGRLSRRIGFRLAPGVSERVIYRELFLKGLTLLDLNGPQTGIAMQMSHVAARHEMRNLLGALNLPGIAQALAAAE